MYSWFYSGIRNLEFLSEPTRCFLKNISEPRFGPGDLLLGRRLITSCTSPGGLVRIEFITSSFVVEVSTGHCWLFNGEGEDTKFRMPMTSEFFLLVFWAVEVWIESGGEQVWEYVDGVVLMIDVCGVVVEEGRI